MCPGQSRPLRHRHGNAARLAQHPRSPLSRMGAVSERYRSGIGDARHFWHDRNVATLLDRLAQIAYEAYRGALPTPVLPWEDITKQERRAWKIAVSTVAGEAGGT